MQATLPNLPAILARAGSDLLDAWLRAQVAAITMRRDLLDEKELRRQSEEFLAVLRTAVGKSDSVDVLGHEWEDVRAFLGRLSRDRADQGFSPSETATFVMSLKEPLFSLLRRELEREPNALFDALWSTTVLLDKLGLLTTEFHLTRREEVIGRQQRELTELSTPVVKLWEGVIAVPLIGTLDSERTQQVMENLLTTIVATNATVAIIDITGVPTVDTLVAQHLLKTIAAARLMGASCILSGIRPQIAQTIVHLGIDLADVTTKATLGDAIATSFQRLGYRISKAGA